MSKHQKNKPSPPPPPSHSRELLERINRAREEGRTQQALELAKTLYKGEATPSNQQVLKDAYVQRAVHLRDQGLSRDAANVLEAASRIDEKNVPWLARLLEEMGSCGDGAKAAVLLKRLQALGGGVDLQAKQAKTTGALIDAAFLDAKNVKSKLPAEWHGEHARIVGAFDHLVGGRDEEVKNVLQPIGIRSPYMEWKLLIRGLQAYYVNDDTRALENWARLSPERLPARLAAPFRAAIDPPYRDAQVPAMRQTLKNQLEGLTPNGVLLHLNALRTAVNGERDEVAFRAAEQGVAGLQSTAPHLIPRLANVMYWYAARQGPANIPRYRRVFGHRFDDRDFKRIEAMACEGDKDDLRMAHSAWQSFEREIASNTKVWPAEEGKLARSLVWLRMGLNALQIPTTKQIAKMPRIVREMGGLPDPLNPGAEACFARALDLAPTLLDAHRGLMNCHLANDETEKALKAGERLVAAHPDHLDTIQQLATLCERLERPEQALMWIESAVRHNPLDRTLRQRASSAYLQIARSNAAKSQFDEARKLYQASLEYSEPREAHRTYVRWSACERKAGDNAKADELLVKARATSPGELLLTYVLAVEAARLSLPQKLKTAYTKAFNAEVKVAFTPPLAVALVEYASALVQHGVNYHGLKTHIKKIGEGAARLPLKQYDERQLVSLMQNLPQLGLPVRTIDGMFDQTEQLHRLSPWFPYLRAVYLMGDVEDQEIGRLFHRLEPLLRQAADLASHRPIEEPGLKDMIEDIERRRTMLRMFNPFAHFHEMFRSGFGPDFFGGEFDDFWDDDDDDDED